MSPQRMGLNSDHRFGAVDGVLRFALIVGSGILTGMILVAALPTLTNWPTEATFYPAAWVSLLKSGLNTRTVVVLAALFFVGRIYSARVGSVDLSLSDPRTLATRLLQLAVVGVFVPLIPTVAVAVFALALAILTDCPRQPGSMRWVGSMFLLFSILDLAGWTAGALGLDQVRGDIPMDLQLVFAIPYLTTFAMVFAMSRSGFGLREYEALLKVIMVGGVFLAGEAGLTRYIGREFLLPGFPSSIYQSTMFMSFLTQSHHVVARVAMTMVFFGLYLHLRVRETRYLVCAGLGLLLLFATFDRAPILATLGALCAYAIQRQGPNSGDQQKWAGRQLARGLIILVTLTLTAGAFARITSVREANSLSTSFETRALLLARSADVFAYVPLFGTGPNLEGYYSGSSDVPPKVLFSAADALGVSRAFAITKVMRGSFLFSDGGYTTHNLWIEIVQHWGIVALVAGCWFFWASARRWHQLTKTRNEWSDPARLTFWFAVCLCVSMLTTVKFEYYWFFFVVFAFADCVGRQAIETEKTAHQEAVTAGQSIRMDDGGS